MTSKQTIDRLTREIDSLPMCSPKQQLLNDRQRLLRVLTDELRRSLNKSMTAKPKDTK